MSIMNNPFSVLQAHPWDSSAELVQKADDLAFFKDVSVENELSMLMQMKKRLGAEIAWFPNASRQDTEQFLKDYELVEKGEGTLPSLDYFSTPMARTNAITGMIELLLPEFPEVYRGCCLSLQDAMTGLTVEDTLYQINQDRLEAGFPVIQDKEEFVRVFDDHLRGIVSSVTGGFGRDMVREDYAKLLLTLKARHNNPQAIYSDRFIQMLMTDYRNRYYGEYESIVDRLLKYCETKKEERANDLNTARQLIEEWESFIRPILPLRANEHENAEKICVGMIEVIVCYYNKMEDMLRAKLNAKGSLTITEIKKTKKNVCLESIDLLRYMTNVFGFSPGLVTRIRKIIDQLEQVKMLF